MDQISKFYNLVASYIKQEWIDKVPQLEYVKKYFRNALDYKGRATRPEFWCPALFNFLLGLVFQMLLSIFGRINFLYQLINFVSFLYSLLCFVPSITVAIRRLHDINQPGWFILLPVVGFFVGSILGLCAVIPIIGGLFAFVGVVLPLLSILVLFILLAMKTH